MPIFPGFARGSCPAMLWLGSSLRLSRYVYSSLLSLSLSFLRGIFDFSFLFLVRPFFESCVCMHGRLFSISNLSSTYTQPCSSSLPPSLPSKIGLHHGRMSHRHGDARPREFPRQRTQAPDESAQDHRRVSQGMGRASPPFPPSLPPSLPACLSPSFDEFIRQRTQTPNEGAQDHRGASQGMGRASPSLPPILLALSLPFSFLAHESNHNHTAPFRC